LRLVWFPSRLRGQHSVLGYKLQILAIFYGNKSLLAADKQIKLEDLANLGYEDRQHFNTSAKIAQPLSISPSNQKLILYNCTKRLASVEGLVETTRRGNGTFARIGGSYNNETSNSSDSYYFLEGCDAIIVPVRGGPGPGKANASNYEELISDGFLLTFQPSPTPAAGNLARSWNA